MVPLPLMRTKGRLKTLLRASFRGHLRDLHSHRFQADAPLSHIGSMHRHAVPGNDIMLL